MPPVLGVMTAAWLVLFLVSCGGNEDQNSASVAVEIRSVVMAYVSAINEGAADDAYDLLASSTQEKCSAEDFADLISILRSSAGERQSEVDSISQVQVQGDHASALVRVGIEGDLGQQDYEFRREGGRWRIASNNIEAGCALVAETTTEIQGPWAFWDGIGIVLITFNEEGELTGYQADTPGRFQDRAGGIHDFFGHGSIEGDTMTFQISDPPELKAPPPGEKIIIEFIGTRVREEDLEELTDVLPAALESSSVFVGDLVRPDGRIRLVGYKLQLRPSTSPTPSGRQTGPTTSPTPTSVTDATNPAVLRPSRIAFVSNRDGNNEMLSDGSSQHRLTFNEATDLLPTWSPDGRLIAFTSERDDNAEVYVMNDDGSEQTRLTYSPGADAAPSWSPDGASIAYQSKRDDNNEIYVMRADGSGQTRLTVDPGADLSPRWSPDGSRLLFVSNRDGDYEIYVMQADGSGQTRLTRNPGADSWPNWCPDGSEIAFSSEQDGSFQIYIMKADGSQQRQLTNGPSLNSTPTWSPSGERILFVADRNVSLQLYVMKADGSEQTRLASGDAGEFHPAWLREEGD